MDREVGAEVYAVATTREQAMSVFKPAFDNIRRWSRRSRGVKRSFTIHEGVNQEKVAFDSSVFKPLPANAESLDGLNPHAILFDELHAQKSADVWEVMESALGARLQPLLSAITTAGFILDGVCTDMRRYLIEVLKGERNDDAFFGYVYTLVPRPIGDDGGVSIAHGDVLLVRSASPIADAERQALAAAFERALPRRVRVVVVGPGIDFDVLTSAPPAVPAEEGA